jgi:hypothetical protein
VRLVTVADNVRPLSLIIHFVYFKELKESKPRTLQPAGRKTLLLQTPSLHPQHQIRKQVHPPPKKRAAPNGSSSAAASAPKKKKRAAPVDPPPNSIPDGHQSGHGRLKKQVDGIPRVQLRHRLSDYHHPLGWPRTEDMRSWDIGRIEEEMKRGEQVNLAFAALESALQRGEQVPIGNPFQYDEGGYWELFSSEVFTKYLSHDIDNLEFKNWEVNRTMHFHDPTMSREQVQEACWC